MIYQMFREVKPRGGVRQNIKNNIFFDEADYEKVTGQFRGQQGTTVNIPTPENPVGYSTYTAYKAALKQLFHEQQAANRSINTAWEHIWLPHFTTLRDQVKLRKQKVKRANYEEKIDGAFAPYAMVEKFPAIEDKLWTSAYSANSQSVGTSLRHRFGCLFTTSSILHSDSGYRAELSDFQGIFLKQLDSDIHPIFVMIMQIPFGKTNKGHIRYGRAMRHKNVKLCCVGAMAF